MASSAGRARKLVLVVVLVVAGIFVGFLLLLRFTHEAVRRAYEQQTEVTAPETGYPFPAHADIARMTAWYWDREDRKEIPDFAVPQQCWDELIDSLSPSQYDPRPAKWQVLGLMVIELKSGEKCRIDLYAVDKGPGFPDLELIGAFSAGPDFGSRKYYRGGRTTTLRAALRRAYAESRKGPDGRAKQSPGRN